MAKQINFEFDGKDYTLEYTRKSVETMEKQGFVAEDITTRPMTTLPALFAGAFVANHRYIKRDVVDKIFDQFKNKQELIGALAEMFNEPIIALLDDNEGEGKNLEWEKNF